MAGATQKCSNCTQQVIAELVRLVRMSTQECPPLNANPPISVEVLPAEQTLTTPACGGNLPERKPQRPRASVPYSWLSSYARREARSWKLLEDRKGVRTFEAQRKNAEQSISAA